ncbi:DEAD/DEAH box helicase [Fusobacterium russii]|uniref:DEAD/DEAH box helicase n=1 Tax=Fusobacterium russii TaxID=854 RepID=UPI0003A3D400|nr:DEAD/DEAH box helicase [Fusobacterium russii]
MKNIINKSIETSIIDSEIESDINYQHSLISNDEEKIMTVLRKHLESCDEFIFSVAFITLGGLTLFLEELKKLEERNVPGKILTGDYLAFTEPKALRKLLSFKNIDLKIISNERFHPKAYFFRKADIWTLIIGSANLTQSALTINFEWNLKINSLSNGKIVKSSLEKFFNIFNSLKKISEIDLKIYEEKYEDIKKFKISYAELNYSSNIKPNLMQNEALKNLKELSVNKNKALLISATGTGKTYLSAFAAKEYGAKKILFISHRKVILEKSIESFKKIFKNKKFELFEKDKIKLFTEGSHKEIIIFAMVQTLNKKEYLEKFSKDYFDYIIIDEVHHSAAKTYQNILNYFEPKFLLGLTATPERTDNFNIYELFDHNIAYEIRLHQAMRENLLCPFHYFGISDLIINGESISDKSSINSLTSDERVKHILDKSDYYGYSGNELHSLIFVSNVQEAKILAYKFNVLGRKAMALSSQNSDTEREEAIKKLEEAELEFLISVDIFNEGIDIPCVNQLILLRPTLSSIVYIQQLGRGLRKNKNKDYTVVLDFIANYEKNFLIPVAISQNSNFDKDSMKRFMMNATNILPGESSISFDEISKERIFENINNSNFSNKKLIEQDFNLLEKQLGRLPLLCDFFDRNMVEPSVILKFKKDYDSVLKSLRPKISLGEINSLERNFLIFLSVFFTPAKRQHEMLILKELLKQKKSMDLEDIISILKTEYGLVEQRTNIENGIKHLAKEIFINLSQIKPYPAILNSRNNKYFLNDSFKESYEKNNYFKTLIDDLIEYNLKYCQRYFKQDGKSTLKLYSEYSKQEAFWYGNLDFNNGYQVSGYTPFTKERKLMIFITMVNSNARNIYTNTFYDSQTFNWFSKSSRYLEKNGMETIEGKIAKGFYNILVFVKKTNGENFYYLGEVDKVLDFKEIKDRQNKTMVEYIFKLKQEVKKDLLDYLTL